MFNHPEDVPNECGACLYLGDDYGDGTCTIRCQLLSGHDGLHKEVCRDNTVNITWENDEREIELELTISETDPNKIDTIHETIWNYGMIIKELDSNGKIIIHCATQNSENFATIDGIIGVENKGFVKFIGCPND